MILRDYQRDIFEQLVSGCSNDLVQLDTGAGKTPIEAALAQWAPRILLVAHRNILITQISEKLAAFGIEHNTISTEHTRRRCMAAHRRHGRNHIRRGHQSHLVASMQSIIAAKRHHRLNIDTGAEWLIVIDEAHHIVRDNMWGQLLDIITNHRLIGFTATPARMDGESLHVDKGGVFERLVQAESLRENSTRTLIDAGYLSGFKAYVPYSNYETEHERRMREDPEYAMTLEAINGPEPEQKPARQEGDHRARVAPLDYMTGKLALYGDPVAEYRRRALGKRAILMAPAISNAEEMARQFRDARIPAACINSTQSPAEIARLLDAFASGRISVLTNVDMVGEGFDLPACECLIIATRTASFPRYRQWCGRVLRPAADKSEAVILDLTGMLVGHGLPDEPVKWDLLNPPCGPLTKRQVPCTKCGAYFEFKLEFCPHCGYQNRWLDEPRGFNPGTYHFDIKVIDQAHVEFVMREKRAADSRTWLETHLIPSPDGFGIDAVGKTITALAAWCPRQLKDGGIPIYDINAFLQSNAARDRQFWMTHFTARDLRSDSPAKAVRVYKKWLKQRSSSVTRATSSARPA
ncbi:MAG: DEAD/DEAH box helicase [Candidatus Competibacter sp.]|nr:DEAD/DEAH box helicase [Candidatus Competibacter sp.]